MCEMPLLKAAKSGNGRYDFSDVFEKTKDLFDKSDYVVGNLETVCAGASAGYTDQMYCFNTPDDFLDALSVSGIDMVTLSNNHCLDRGVDGIYSTMQKLDERGIEHTGIFKDEKDAVFIKEIDGTKIAFLAASYGTNTSTNGVILSQEDGNIIRLMRNQQDNLYKAENKDKKSIKDVIMFLPRKILSKERKMYIKKKLGMKYNSPKVDDNLDAEKIAPYMDKIADDIKRAKEKADLVIYLPHIGGQFNGEPGRFSQYIMNFLAHNGADIVVGSHPHVVQKIEWMNSAEGRIPCLYSIGNYSMSPSSVYVLKDNLPEYGIIFNTYISMKKIEKYSFSIIKMVENKKHGLSVYPVSLLYDELNDEDKIKLEADCTRIYNKFLQKNVDKIDISDEYFFEYEDE